MHSKRRWHGWLAGVWLACLLSGAAAPVCRAAEPAVLSDAVAVGQTFMNLRLLGALYLSDADVPGGGLGGLSGLAWDADDQRLYAVSDVGRLYHLRPRWQGGRLVDVEVLAVYPLRDPQGRPLTQRRGDAEGLVLDNGANGVTGDARLVVSFEIEPRVEVFDVQGRYRGSEALPPALRDPRVFVKGNTALEAITRHPRWGLLLAPERPLRGMSRAWVPVFSQSGENWSYRLAPAPKSSLVAMEALADGSLVTLERAFVSLLRPLVITLRHTRMPEAGNRLTTEDIAVLDSSKGWLLDNFEGLAWHRDRRFFMVSDDNFNQVQSTLLVYFEWVTRP